MRHYYYLGYRHTAITMASKILEGVTELVRRDGTKASPSDLDDVPVVALYFSAHWCPPCRAFTPVLQEFYEVSSNTF